MPTDVFVCRPLKHVNVMLDRVLHSVFSFLVLLIHGMSVNEEDKIINSKKQKHKKIHRNESNNEFVFEHIMNTVVLLLASRQLPKKISQGVLIRSVRFLLPPVNANNTCIPLWFVY